MVSTGVNTKGRDLRKIAIVCEAAHGVSTDVNSKGRDPRKIAIVCELHMEPLWV